MATRATESSSKRSSVWARFDGFELDEANARLLRAISDLRTVLDDESRQPRFIQTVFRRGYRFIAATTTISTESSVPRKRPVDRLRRAAAVGSLLGHAIASWPPAWDAPCSAERVVRDSDSWMRDIGCGLPQPSFATMEEVCYAHELRLQLRARFLRHIAPETRRRRRAHRSRRRPWPGRRRRRPPRRTPRSRAPRRPAPQAGRPRARSREHRVVGDRLALGQVRARAARSFSCALHAALGGQVEQPVGVEGVAGPGAVEAVVAGRPRRRDVGHPRRSCASAWVDATRRTSRPGARRGRRRRSARRASGRARSCATRPRPRRAWSNRASAASKRRLPM